MEWLKSGGDVAFYGAAASAASPAAGAGDEQVVYRPAKLFEAGAYPDKNLEVSESDLDGIIARFNAARAEGAPAVPVKVEHVDTPLDPLAEVVALHRRGRELFGMVAVPADVDALLRRRGIESLSVGLSREPLALREVSIVARPRVADAAFLPARGQERLARWQQEGKVTPATHEPALALLSAAAPVTFAGGQTLDVAETFERFLRALPVVQPRGAQVPAGFGGGWSDEAAGAPVSPLAGRIAQALGIDAARLAERVAGGHAGKGPPAAGRRA